MFAVAFTLQACQGIDVPTGAGAEFALQTAGPATSTTPLGDGEVVPSPCPYPVFRVAAGTDITVSWATLTEDGYGRAIPVPQHPSVHGWVLALDAATAEATCAFVGDQIVDHVILDVGGEPSSEVSVAPEHLPEGGATALQLVIGRVGIAALLLEPTVGSSVTRVEVTPAAWVF